MTVRALTAAPEGADSDPSADTDPDFAGLRAYPPFVALITPQPYTIAPR